MDDMNYIHRSPHGEEVDPDDRAVQNAHHEQLVAKAREMLGEDAIWMLFSSRERDEGVMAFEMLASMDVTEDALQRFITMLAIRTIEAMADIFQVPFTEVASALFANVVAHAFGELGLTNNVPDA